MLLGTSHGSFASVKQNNSLGSPIRQEASGVKFYPIEKE